MTQFYQNIILKFVTHHSFFMDITSRLISFIFFSVSVFESSRFISGIIVILTIAAHLVVDCILHLDTIFTHWSCNGFNEILGRYAILQIILQASYEITSSAVILCMSVAFLSLISCNFVCLKMYDKFPISIYLVAFTLSVVVSVLLKVMMNIIVDIYENGKVLRAKLLVELCELRNIKYFKRKLASVRVVSLYGGLLGFNVYKVHTYVRTRYYWEIVDYTINLCLSVEL